MQMKQKFSWFVTILLFGSSAPAIKNTPTFTPTACQFGTAMPAIGGRTLVCGVLDVPAHYADPLGPHYALPVGVYRAPAASRMLDPTIILNGGPGQRTASLAPVLTTLAAVLAPHRDLIVFDQRGVGEVRPNLACPEAVLHMSQNFTRTVNQGTEQLTQDIQACFKRSQTQGVQLDSFNSQESADDVAALAQALGATKINLYGGSYGSRLAQEVMRRHPDLLRAIILDGVVTTNVNYLQNRLSTADAALRAHLTYCKSDPACNRAYPQLSERLEALASRLDHHPPQIAVQDVKSNHPLQIPLNTANFGNLLTLFLYSTALTPSLPAFIDTVDKGHYESLPGLFEVLQALGALNTLGMQFAVGCNEVVPYGQPKDQVSTGATRVMTAVFDKALGMYSAACVGFTWARLPATLRQPVDSNVPTLMLSGLFDPVTPPAYAREVAAHLSQAQLVEFVDGAHGQLDLSGSHACANDLMTSFITDPLTRVKPDCASIPRPFTLPYSP
ncbi:alpha/beta hydrolase [Deinococcus psychrotolerans]|uniref:Alpha/beta hydrolase n=1 Tax=Deinococcus psychrotolerans TaxID=2489213 RepID=A0A3G8YGK9_9DEIO|nr:alpha/beta hydrolase [Deinococcus psychrotolerans]AZI44075.1 alpha/beta hydrolase [Deinococcus psychrotolerans]